MTLVIVAPLLNQCAPQTPAARIAKNPEIFASQSKQHQQAIQDGKVMEGMSSDAVRLSWGEPEQRYLGSYQGADQERWDYMGQMPIYVRNDSFSYGTHHHSSSLSSSFQETNVVISGANFANVPYRKASVLLRNGKVDSWEELQE